MAHGFAMFFFSRTDVSHVILNLVVLCSHENELLHLMPMVCSYLFVINSMKLHTLNCVKMQKVVDQVFQEHAIHVFC
jgi:hypothetical protein